MWPVVLYEKNKEPLNPMMKEDLGSGSYLLLNSSYQKESMR